MGVSTTIPDKIRALIVVDIMPMAFSGSVLLKYTDALKQLNLSEYKTRSNLNQALKDSIPVISYLFFKTLTFILEYTD